MSMKKRHVLRASQKLESERRLLLTNGKASAEELAKELTRNTIEPSKQTIVHNHLGGVIALETDIKPATLAGVSGVVDNLLMSSISHSPLDTSIKLDMKDATSNNASSLLHNSTSGVHNLLGMTVGQEDVLVEHSQSTTSSTIHNDSNHTVTTTLVTRPQIMQQYQVLQQEEENRLQLLKQIQHTMHHQQQQQYLLQLVQGGLQVDLKQQSLMHEHQKQLPSALQQLQQISQLQFQGNQQENGQKQQQHLQQQNLKKQNLQQQQKLQQQQHIEQQSIEQQQHLEQQSLKKQQNLPQQRNLQQEFQQHSQQQPKQLEQVKLEKVEQPFPSLLKPIQTNSSVLHQQDVNSIKEQKQLIPSQVKEIKEETTETLSSSSRKQKASSVSSKISVQMVDDSRELAPINDKPFSSSDQPETMVTCEAAKSTSTKRPADTQTDNSNNATEPTNKKLKLEVIEETLSSSNVKTHVEAIHASSNTQNNDYDTKVLNNAVSSSSSSSTSILDCISSSTTAELTENIQKVSTTTAKAPPTTTIAELVPPVVNNSTTTVTSVGTLPIEISAVKTSLIRKLSNGSNSDAKSLTTSPRTSLDSNPADGESTSNEQPTGKKKVGN